MWNINQIALMYLSFYTFCTLDINGFIEVTACFRLLKNWRLFHKILSSYCSLSWIRMMRSVRVCVCTCSGWRCVSWRGNVCISAGSSWCLHRCWRNSSAPAAHLHYTTYSDPERERFTQGLSFDTQKFLWFIFWNNCL